MKFENWLTAPPGDVFNDKGERISGMVVGLDAIETHFEVSFAPEIDVKVIDLGGKKFEVRRLRRPPQFLVTQVAAEN